MLLRLAAIAVSMTLSGCTSARIEVQSVEPSMTGPTVASTSQPARERGRPWRQALLLSSGGADGAFGAGVLAGWTATGRRPVFDVVSGVSTGALQATAAFLGSDYDGLLREVYTTTRTDDVLDSNGPGILFKAGLYDLEPLRERLTRIIDDATLDKVAAEHRRGRRLYVGTTDLTQGRVVTWDLGSIAASSDLGRRERYIGILLASVAAPGLIQPITVRSGITRAEHGDGGVMAPILLDAMMLSQMASGAQVWVIANGHVSPAAASSTTVDGVLTAGRRTVSQLLRRLLHTTVVATAYEVRARRGSVRLLALPDEVPEARDPFVFEPAEMQELYEAGWQLGQRPGSWQAMPRAVP